MESFLARLYHQRLNWVKQDYYSIPIIQSTHTVSIPQKTMNAETQAIAQMLELQAWQRAKGELYSVLETHLSSNPGEHDEFLQKKAAIDEFVSNFENNYL